MKRPASAFRLTVAILAMLASPAGVGAQEQGSGSLSAADEERLRMLSDPEAIKKDAAKDKNRPPFEIYRSQVAPSDVLPWVKARHWHSMRLELRANLDDFEGALQTSPIPLPDTTQDVTFGREARLVKEQRTALGLSLMIPRANGVKELPVELVRAGAIRPDLVYQASVRPIAPHQMLALVLTKDGNSGYSAWSRLNATLPGSLDRADVQGAELLRYYRLVLPLEPDKPLLPTHPLTWTAVSHVFWDGMEPDVISVAQQEAIVDWLHWGGQLVVMGGAGPKFSVLRESFLDPYLPADPTGDGRALGPADLQALSESYRPPPGYAPPPAESPANQRRRMQADMAPQRRPNYDRPDPIHPETDRPVHAAGMRPRPGSTVVPMGPGGEVPLAVERRVGRGRITMLAVNPTEPALVAWKGLDTMVRRVILRRPEEAMVGLGTVDGPGQPIRSMLGPDLSWYRIATRDVGVPPPPQEQAPDAPGFRQAVPGGGQVTGVDFGGSLASEGLPALMGVAEWRDDSQIPWICRNALERSSGIRVPSSSFVLKVILAYVLAAAPLNWLVCRVVLRRREVAWLVAPTLALAFAVGVERVAAYDLGFDSAGDELDVLELQADSPRGHLSRFGSLYTTGHGRFAIRFPDDPTALALPLSSGRSIAGEDRTTAAWRSYPVAGLEDFVVQPRSLSMFRAEQMLTLPGPIAFGSEGGRRTVRNDSGLELRDATLAVFHGRDDVRETYLGTLAPGASIELDDGGARDTPEQVAGFDGPDPSALLAALRKSTENKPEEQGEVRLTAWTPGPVDGPRFEPGLDRRRGSTVVVAHLRYDPPPDPGGRRYDLTSIQDH